MKLKDPRPYVIHAHIMWLEDSDASPHLVLQNGPTTKFPPHLSAHSVVTFKVTAEAVRNLHLDSDGVSFSARFSGKEFTVYAPLDCVLMLQSADGQVRIPLQHQAQPENIPQSEKGPFMRDVTPEEVQQTVERKKPELSVIEGGNTDGIRRGKLSLVPKSKPPYTEPEEPECA